MRVPLKQYWNEWSKARGTKEDFVSCIHTPVMIEVNSRSHVEMKRRAETWRTATIQSADWAPENICLMCRCSFNIERTKPGNRWPTNVSKMLVHYVIWPYYLVTMILCEFGGKLWSPAPTFARYINRGKRTLLWWFVSYVTFVHIYNDETNKSTRTKLNLHLFYSS